MKRELMPPKESAEIHLVAEKVGRRGAQMNSTAQSDLRGSILSDDLDPTRLQVPAGIADLDIEPLGTKTGDSLVADELRRVSRSLQQETGGVPQLDHGESFIMRSVSPRELRRLRNDVPVTEVIDQLHVPTARRGARRTFRCPRCEGFHTGVNSRANLARCFRCAGNFNPIDLVMAERGWSFLDAVRYLSDLAADGAGVEVDASGAPTPSTRL